MWQTFSTCCVHALQITVKPPFDIDRVARQRQTIQVCPLLQPETIPKKKKEEESNNMWVRGPKENGGMHVPQAKQVASQQRRQSTLCTCVVYTALCLFLTETHRLLHGNCKLLLQLFQALVWG
jgi:hypothetical protein